MREISQKPISCIAERGRNITSIEILRIFRAAYRAVACSCLARF